MVCALIAQPASADPILLAREHRRMLGFHYLMSNALACCIAIDDQLAEHAKLGIAREMTVGSIAGFKSARAVLINAGIDSVIPSGWRFDTRSTPPANNCGPTSPPTGFATQRWQLRKHLFLTIQRENG